jgi:hypothetical protein
MRSLKSLSSWPTMTNPGGRRLILTAQQVVRVFAATALRPTCVIRNVRTLIIRSLVETVSTATVTKPSHTIPASIGVEKPYAIKIASVTPRCPERAKMRSACRRSRLRRGAAVFLPRVPFELWAIIGLTKAPRFPDHHTSLALDFTGWSVARCHPVRRHFLP